jgi:hypothetical protein
MSKYNMYVEDVSVEAVFNKLGGVEGARRFLRDELAVSELSHNVNRSGVIRPLDFDLATIFCSGWKYSDKKGDTDDRSLELTEADFSKVLFQTCLRKGEPSITGEEKLKRLIASGNIRLDPRFGAALFQEERHATLERLYKERNVTYLDFPGQVLLNPLGNRYVLYLSRNVGRWLLNAFWLGHGWDSRDFSVSLAS